MFALTIDIIEINIEQYYIIFISLFIFIFFYCLIELLTFFFVNTIQNNSSINYTQLLLYLFYNIQTTRLILYRCIIDNDRFENKQ